MNHHVGIKVDQVREGVGQNLERPRQASEESILIADFDKVGNHGEKGNRGDVLIK